MNTQDIMNNINRMIANDPDLRSLFPRGASYRYYLNKETRDKYFYTTEKINRKGKARFVSGVYRYLKSKRIWTPLYQAGHAKKKDAIARAHKLYQAKA